MAEAIQPPLHLLPAPLPRLPLFGGLLLFEINRMYDRQSVRHIPQVLQQISLFTFGNADIIHIIVKF